MLRAIAFLILFSSIVWSQPAPKDPPFWPNTQYDPSIPTMQKTLGYEPGKRITWHYNLIKYMEALAAARPSQMKIWDYGKTWEGRRLVYAAISSEKNIARLSEIQAAMKRLADPRKTAEGDAKRLMNGLPAVIWLGYGVHGNEISSPDAALVMAYHLLAARNNPIVQSILDNTVVLIDPIQNPDGRDRFVHNFEQSEGLAPDANPAAAEHQEPWPNGRTNHYHFDMNRDWFALTQPETVGRVKVLQDWFPLVFVDLHEMGSESTYYFAPEANPFNPHLVKWQKTSLDWFGRNNAKWFDEFGFNYFTREVYDAFYPGYGASWPSYYGAIAMTYEQASARGLLMRRRDDSEFSFRDTVRQHFVASLSTAEAAAQHRAELIDNFYRYRATAIEEGRSEPIKEYLLPRRGNVSNVDKLASILLQQGVEVKRARAAFKAGDVEAPAGSYVIPLAQPAKRLVRTLLDRDVPMEDFFIKEEERRRKARLGRSEIYDVTAWSVPLQFNVEAIPRNEVSRGDFEDLKPGFTLEGGVNGKAAVAYLVPWGPTAAARFLTAALREGLKVLSTDMPFKQNGKTYPRGTLIVRVKDHDDTLHAKVERLAKSSGALADATATGWVDEGVNFGSRYVNQIRPAAVALLWDRPASPSAGHTRFVLERQFGYPVTPIRSYSLSSANLSKFHVLIVPEAFGDFYSAIGADGVRRLKDWVSAGGTIIGIGGGMSFLADPRVGLLAAQQENLARPPAAAGASGSERPSPGPGAGAPAGSPSATPSGRVPGKLLKSAEDLQKATQPEQESPDSVPGVIARARLDADHWITAGADNSVHALIQGRSIYAPLKADRGVNAVYLEAPDKLLASGYLWQENRDQLAFKPWLLVQREGRGHVIGFVSDPNFRAYLDGLNVLFVNAVFRGPAHSAGGGEAAFEEEDRR